VLGDISLVPDYLQRSMATAIHKTRNNTKYVRKDSANAPVCVFVVSSHSHHHAVPGRC
jgi:hypothetical protein